MRKYTGFSCNLIGPFFRRLHSGHAHNNDDVFHKFSGGDAYKRGRTVTGKATNFYFPSIEMAAHFAVSLSMAFSATREVHTTQNSL